MVASFSLKPILYNNVDLIEANEEVVVAFCLPLYAPTTKSELRVKIEDGNGSRILLLKIPGKELLKSKMFEE